MKYLQFSNPVKKYLQLVLMLSIVLFNFGFYGATTTHATGVAPANDQIENATAIGALPYAPGILDTTGAHQEVGEPNIYDYAGGCEGKLLRNGLASVWYTYNPGGSNASVYLDTSGSTTSVPNPDNGNLPYEYDTYIAVYTGTIGNLNLFACNDNPNNGTNQAQLAFYAKSNTTYYIQVAEYDGKQGDNHVYPGYNGGALSFTMTAGLTISGNVGIGGTGTKISYIGGGTTAASNGDYILAVPSGFSGTVTPSLLLASGTFTPTSKSYINVTTSKTGENYTAQRTFTKFGKWTSSFDKSHGWTVSDYVRTVGDVSGDGMEDLVGFGLDGVYIGVSAGTAIASPTKWTSSFDLSHGWTVKDYVRTVGDVNGDGRTDLVGFGLDGVYVGLSTGSAFAATPTKWTSSFDKSHGWTVSDYVRTVGDVNGDGLDDLVGFGLDGVYVGISTGGAFAAPAKWTSAFDLSHGWTVKDYVRTVGDVNGDGMADLVGFGLDGVYVALSTGSGFGPASKWISAFDSSHGWTVSDYVRTVGDMNGDGKTDLVGFGLDGVYIATSTGSGFGGISKWTSAFDLSHGWTVKDYVRTVGDMNGDGLDDLVGFGLDGVYIAP